jgi:hypothetical protein
MVAVSPPGPVVAVPPPGPVIGPLSAAIAMPPTMTDRLHSIDTFPAADEIGLRYGRQSARRLAQEQDSGNHRRYRKRHCLGVIISRPLIKTSHLYARGDSILRH